MLDRSRTHTSSRRPRAFTLIELMACLVILGLLYAISLAVFNQAYAGGQQQATQEQIQIALSDGLRVASLPGNHFTFPATTVSQIVLPSPLSISTGTSGGNVLSGDVVTGGGAASNELLVVNYINGTCVLGLVNSDEAMTWGTSTEDSGSCVASSYAQESGSITGSKSDPSVVPSP